MARTDRRTKNTPPKRGTSNLNKWAIGAFVIGVIGLVAIDELAGKLFFLLVAVAGGILYARPFIKKALTKKEDAEPMQQFQPASSSTPTPPAEFINAAGHRQGSLYEFVPVKVAGVTFKNGRRHRQTILRQIYWKDEPYHKGVEVTLRQGEYEGQPTVEVWANEEQIGFVPKEQLPFFLNNWHRYHSAFDLEVSGGGNMPDGEKVNYGAEFTARFTVQ